MQHQNESADNSLYSNQLKNKRKKIKKTRGEEITNQKNKQTNKQNDHNTVYKHVQTDEFLRE